MGNVKRLYQALIPILLLPLLGSLAQSLITMLCAASLGAFYIAADSVTGTLYSAAGMALYAAAIMAAVLTTANSMLLSTSMCVVRDFGGITRQSGIFAGLSGSLSCSLRFYITHNVNRHGHAHISVKRSFGGVVVVKRGEIIRASLRQFFGSVHNVKVCADARRISDLSDFVILFAENNRRLSSADISFCSMKLEESRLNVKLNLFASFSGNFLRTGKSRVRLIDLCACYSAVENIPRRRNAYSPLIS